MEGNTLKKLESKEVEKKVKLDGAKKAEPKIHWRERQKAKSIEAVRRKKREKEDKKEKEEKKPKEKEEKKPKEEKKEKEDMRDKEEKREKGGPEKRGGSEGDKNMKTVVGGKDKGREGAADRVEKNGDAKQQSWAYALIRKRARQTFKDKACAYENLHELFWTILHQRPEVRWTIVGMCKRFDKQYVGYWERVSTANVTIANVPRDIPMLTGDPLDASIVPGGPFLDFSDEMRKLIFVDTAALVREMSADIERRAEEPGGLSVGLDAEWFVFSTCPGASILQISLVDVSYIVDIDGLAANILHPFIERLFSHPKILKLGFSFHHDLAELRKADSLKGCASLESPMNLTCLLRLIMTLEEESKKQPNAAEILAEFGLDPSSNVSKASLSSICQSLLGLPLDKREQCSVWTRRPLRTLQLRYAAMDAFCLLLIHSRCKEWAERLGVTTEEMEEKSRINAETEEELAREREEKRKAAKRAERQRARARKAAERKEMDKKENEVKHETDTH